MPSNKYVFFPVISLLTNHEAPFNLNIVLRFHPPFEPISALFTISDLRLLTSIRYLMSRRIYNVRRSSNKHNITVVPRPLSNDPRLFQCIYRYSHASKRFVEVYILLIPALCMLGQFACFCFLLILSKSIF